MRRLFALLLMSLVATGLGGCGDGPSLAERRDKLTAQARQLREDVRAEVRQRTQKLRARTERIRARARKVGADLARRVRQALDDLDRTVPRAGPQTRAPRTAVGAGDRQIEAFLTETLDSVDAYWTETFRANDIPAPRVGFTILPEGATSSTRCDEDADDTAAFYCPSDDTIYVGERIAAGIIDGVLDGFPGQQAGQGRAVGDFGAAYLVAHEYAHNVQEELGFFDAEREGASARPFELQADCLAGVWGASVYRAGLLDDGDVQEALSTALAVGDFEVGSPQHHGTPEERRDAWQLGFESGEPSSCTAFVRA